MTSAQVGALPLAKSVSLEQGAMSMINPLTAVAFMEITKEGGHEAIVLTAAASALGQMVNRLARSEGVQVINIVRRAAQVELLQKKGAAVVLNSSEADFDQQLHDACHKYHVHLAFDASFSPITRRLWTHCRTKTKSLYTAAFLMKRLGSASAASSSKARRLEGFLDGSLNKQQESELNWWPVLAARTEAHGQGAQESKIQFESQLPEDKGNNPGFSYLSQIAGGKVLFRPGGSFIVVCLLSRF